MRLHADIVTERLVIKEHSIADLDTMHTLLSDNKAMYYLQDIKTENIEETRNNLMAAINEINSENRTKYFFRIELKNAEYLGEIGFTVTSESPVGSIVDLGYFILEKHWNQGYTFEAVRSLIDYSFKNFNVYKIETGCIENNRASENIMKKLGMKKESHKKHHVFHDRDLKDRVEYAIFKSEWEKMNEIFTDKLLV